MQAGRLNRRIELHRPDKAVDTTTGEESVSYTLARTVWAEVVQVRGNESFSALQRYAEVTHRFRMRWASDLTVEWRIVYEDRAYDITELLEVGRREGLDVLGVARAE